MKFVLDASVFFADLPLDGELYTTPLVVSELRDLRSKCRLESLRTRGLVVTEPGPESRRRVKNAADRSGDRTVLSPADIDLLALALELGAFLCTDDFAIQNTACVLGIQTRSLVQRKAGRRTWRFRCSGCGRYSGQPGYCPVCGAIIKRKLK
jgi:UPF0271 protein